MMHVLCPVDHDHDREIPPLNASLISTKWPETVDCTSKDGRRHAPIWCTPAEATAPVKGCHPSASPLGSGAGWGEVGPGLDFLPVLGRAAWHCRARLLFAAGATGRVASWSVSSLVREICAACASVMLQVIHRSSEEKGQIAFLVRYVRGSCVQLVATCSSLDVLPAKSG